MTPSNTARETAAVTEVRCLHIPIAGGFLLLPNTAVAEVAPLEEIRELPLEGDRPDWLLGGVLWRTLLVPVVSYEAALGGTAPETGTGTRVVVFNSLSGKPGLPFFAALAQGIPRLIRVSEENLSGEDAGLPLVKASIDYHGERGLIPDLDALERKLRELGLSIRFEREKLSLRR